MLEVKDLHVNYGAVHALNGISLHVDDGLIFDFINLLSLSFSVVNRHIGVEFNHFPTVLTYRHNTGIRQ